MDRITKETPKTPGRYQPEIKVLALKHFLLLGPTEAEAVLKKDGFCIASSTFYLWQKEHPELLAQAKKEIDSEYGRKLRGLINRVLDRLGADINELDPKTLIGLLNSAWDKLQISEGRETEHLRLGGDMRVEILRHLSEISRKKKGEDPTEP